MEEIWKDIDNFIGSYQISNTGKVKSLERIINKYCRVNELILSPGLRGDYLTINLVNNRIYTSGPIHVLVATAFIPNPENKRCVNHKDGNKLNNNDWNLEWVTHSENTKHAYSIGLKNSDSVIRAVIDINTNQEFKSIKEASDFYGIRTNTLVRYLSGIRTNKTNLRYKI